MHKFDISPKKTIRKNYKGRDCRSYDKNDLFAPAQHGFVAGRSCVVVVALLFYVHGKHLRSCRDGQLT